MSPAGQKVSNMLPGKSGGQLLIAPERMKRLGQSGNDAQLWIFLQAQSSRRCRQTDLRSAVLHIGALVPEKEIGGLISILSPLLRTFLSLYRGSTLFPHLFPQTSQEKTPGRPTSQDSARLSGEEDLAQG